MSDTFEQSCEISRKLNEMVRTNQDILAAYGTYKSVFLFQNSSVVVNEKTMQFERKLTEIDNCIDTVNEAIKVLQHVVNDIDSLNEPL